MKKFITLLIVCTGLLNLAGPVPEGRGVTGTATTTPAAVYVTGTNYCYSVSVDNSGSVPIRFDKILTSTVNTNGFVAAESLVVPAGKSYTTAGGTITNEEKSRRIYGIVIATESSTAAYSVNFE